MSTVAMLGDDQWHRLLDLMNSRQETFPMQQQQQQQPAARQAPLRQSDAQPAHAGDQGFAELNAMNFNPPVNGTFDSEPDFATFAAPQAPLRQISLDDISMIELQRIAKELEGVKQRLEARSRQVDRLLNNMHEVFAHLAEIQPFLTETRSMLKEVLSRVGHAWIDPDDHQGSQPDGDHDPATLGLPLEANSNR